MQGAAAVKRHTYEEYLALEVGTEEKLELFDGQIYAMSGGSPGHSRDVRDGAARIEPLDCELPLDIVYRDPLAF